MGLNELTGIREWWQGGEKTVLSRQKERLQADEDIALFTSAILKAKEKLKEKVAKLLKNPKMGEKSYCKEKATAIEKMEGFEPAKYLQLFEQCSEFLSKVFPTVMCSACDPTMQKSVDLANNLVTLDKKS